ncbi:MAG: hypothetical protein WD029_04985, partial [Microthrixaceae bacterium]
MNAVSQSEVEASSLRSPISRSRGLFALMAVVMVSSSFVALSAGVAGADVSEFSVPGTYTFEVPTGITSLTVLVAGGSGGGSDGGSGAIVAQTLTVIPGLSLQINVGCAGIALANGAGVCGGGGGAFGGGGGGSSDIRTGEFAAADRSVVAGGGGGFSVFGGAGGDAGSGGVTNSGSGGAPGSAGTGGAGGASGGDCCSSGGDGSNIAGGGGGRLAEGSASPPRA